jgi:hypothetical protein
MTGFFMSRFRDMLERTGALIRCRREFGSGRRGADVREERTGEMLEVVDSVRSSEPSPCGNAFGDSILTVSNGQDSTAAKGLTFVQDDDLLNESLSRRGGAA